MHIGDQLLKKTVSYILRPVPMILPAYRPSAIKTPAAIARMPMSKPSPEKLRLSSDISPVMMSQTANKIMPRFLVS